MQELNKKLTLEQIREVIYKYFDDNACRIPYHKNTKNLCTNYIKHDCNPFRNCRICLMAEFEKVANDQP